MSGDPKLVGQRVREERERRGWNRPRLNVESGVGESSIDAIEAGKRPIESYARANLVALSYTLWGTSDAIERIARGEEPEDVVSVLQRIEEQLARLKQT